MPITPAMATLIGSGMQAAGGAITNFINRRNIQDANELRYKMFREQMDYNDASSQMMRQMASGLHPMTLSGSQPADAPTSPDVEAFEARNPFHGAIDTGSSVAQQMLREKELHLSERQLDIEHLQTTVQALNAVTALMGENATTSEALSMLQKITGLTPTDGDLAVDLHRDETLLNSLSNQIRQSDLSVEEKEITLKWLDEFKKAEYDLTVAQTSETYSKDALNKANIKVANSIASLNEVEKEHVEQLIANLKEQWKSLHYQGTLDSKRMRFVTKESKLLIEKLTHETNVSRQEASYWVWSNIIKSNIGNYLLEASHIEQPFVEPYRKPYYRGE